jgi:hypothetical protein
MTRADVIHDLLDAMRSTFLDDMAHADAADVATLLSVVASRAAVLADRMADEVSVAIMLDELDTL